MKKLNSLLGLLITITILSCSSDNNNEIQDIIIGTWKPVKYAEFYTNAGEVTHEHSTCYQQSRITFSTNGNLDQLIFEENINGDCLEENDINFISGTWEKTSQNQYKFLITFFNEDTQENETFEGEQDDLVFPNENTMRIIFNEGQEFNGDILEYEYDEYVRVE